MRGLGVGKKRTVSPTITGIILPSKLDENGRPFRIVLRTDDRREYRIDFGGAGKELLTQLHQRVTVQGKLRQQLDGAETLIVRKFEVSPPNCEEQTATGSPGSDPEERLPYGSEGYATVASSTEIH